MTIIGEKINSFVPAVARAISARDRECIAGLARLQVDCGADYLDLCAGADPANERADLAWLLEVVQEAVDTPVCLDSTDSEILRDVLPLAKRPGIVNSISGQIESHDRLLRAVARTPWKLIALTCDSRGVPRDADTRVSIATAIVDAGCRYGIDRDRLILDPMVTALAAAPDSVECFTESVRRVCSLFPGIHIACGVSNISYGMPCRGAVNRQFLSLAIEAGTDFAILDPTTAEMRTAWYATMALLGRDRHGMAFLRAYRKGRFQCADQKPQSNREP